VAHGKKLQRNTKKKQTPAPQGAKKGATQGPTPGTPPRGQTRAGAQRGGKNKCVGGGMGITSWLVRALPLLHNNKFLISFTKGKSRGGGGDFFQRGRAYVEGPDLALRTNVGGRAVRGRGAHGVMPKGGLGTGENSTTTLSTVVRVRGGNKKGNKNPRGGAKLPKGGGGAPGVGWGTRRRGTKGGQPCSNTPDFGRGNDKGGGGGGRWTLAQARHLCCDDNPGPTGAGMLFRGVCGGPLTLGGRFLAKKIGQPWEQAVRGAGGVDFGDRLSWPGRGTDREKGVGGGGTTRRG